MKTIGLTGGIGTGKTEASKILKDLGAEVISADAMGHRAYAKGTVGWREVVKAFGQEVLSPDGEVDRDKLGALVFGDERRLRTLNAIVHPRVRKMVEERSSELRALGTQVVVVEAALLIEAGWDDMVDEVWATATSEKAAIERVVVHRGLGPEAVRARIVSQMPQKGHLAHADVVIDNTGTLDDLRDRVVQAWKERITRRQPRP